ncbi:hypothetical protein [Sphingomonas sp.]|uniref:hypothetical protein n=1 Tax=Sphingomonas sp. TaxID=28214 RepID=UPI002FD91F1A
MQHTSPNWPSDPRAVELLADIAANPPRMKPQLGRFSWNEVVETVLVYDDSDDRVDELKRLSNKAFTYALDVEGIAAAKLVPSLNDVIGLAVLRGRKVAA